MPPLDKFRFVANDGSVKYSTTSKVVSNTVKNEVSPAISTDENNIHQRGLDGISISNATINESGHLIITRTDNIVIDAGLAISSNGINGINGINGSNGSNGSNGISISNAIINGSGHLVLTRTDNTSIDVGLVISSNGINGINGSNGNNGSNGISISNAIINGSGHLVLTRTDNTSIDVGLVISSNGINGINGINGSNGISISNAIINGSGHLVLTRTDNTLIDVGLVISSNGSNSVANLTSGIPIGEMDPNIHHTKLIAASNPVIWFFGDSTMTMGGENPVNINYCTQTSIRTILQRNYPSKTFTFYNFAVGGTGINHAVTQIAGAVSGGTTPTQIYIGTGVNNGPYFADTDLLAALNAITNIAAKPDTFFITPRHTNSQNAYNSNTAYWQPSMDWISAYIRSVARGGIAAMLGVTAPPSFCCIDIGRAYTCGVKGYDNDLQYLTEVISATGSAVAVGNTSGVFTFPSACDGDFDYTVTFPGQAAALLALPVQIQFGMDSIGLNRCHATIAWGTGVLYANYRSGDNGYNNINTAFNIATPTGDASFSCYTRRGQIFLSYNGNILINGLGARYAAGPITPYITITSMPVGTTMNINSYFAGVAKKTKPITDEVSYYGLLNGHDGNQINHPGSQGYVLVDEPYLLSLNWSKNTVAYVPVANLTVTGTVNANTILATSGTFGSISTTGSSNYLGPTNVNILAVTGGATIQSGGISVNGTVTANTILATSGTFGSISTAANGVSYMGQVNTTLLGVTGIAYLLAGTNIAGGAAFYSNNAAFNTDLTKHISLYSTTYGFGVTANRLNLVIPAGASQVTVINSVDVMTVNAIGVTINGTLTTSGNQYITGAMYATGGIGAFGMTPPSSKPVITGSRASNTANILAQILTSLSNAGFITDSTTS